MHGEAERLRGCTTGIAQRFDDDDRIVYLGNYLGRGSAVAATIDELLDFRRRVLARPRGFACDIVYLRGAQEEMWQKLLQLQFARNPGEVLAWMVRRGGRGDGAAPMAAICARGLPRPATGRA